MLPIPEAPKLVGEVTQLLPLFDLRRSAGPIAHHLPVGGCDLVICQTRGSERPISAFTCATASGLAAGHTINGTIRPVLLACLSADWTVPTARVYATCSAFVRPGSHHVSTGTDRLLQVWWLFLNN
ncbi:hypothetical protein CDO30_22565 (plasmid) [Sinorhizobium meliloti]|uniref:Uncharacterized protein n=1 Tax=Rhizobium meliloti (strain 1021) TaxID=266834 RepID=Q92XR3_RHIME|nr:hypothetical protein SMa2169 [Sinorhizobium meliloti 1021]AGG70877.1 Hypothetical protein SM2011_a2169 [Sinorhizobium meliloti 2011]ASP61011.1 hypothetical protein CDO30_22565 [Sinorhizobium meliloti]